MAIAATITAVEQKTCTKCGASLPATLEFFCRDAKGPLGLFYWCRACGKAASKRYYDAHRARMVELSTARKKALLAASEPHREIERGYAREAKRRALANPEKRDRIRAQHKRWVAEHPGCHLKKPSRTRPAMAAAQARRYAAERQATPSWADRDRIALVYEEAARLTHATGVPHDVDHVVPLRGRAVCGLHVHYNLRAIPAVDNRRKSNRMEDHL